MAAPNKSQKNDSHKIIWIYLLRYLPNYYIYYLTVQTYSNYAHPFIARAIYVTQLEFQVYLIIHLYVNLNFTMYFHMFILCL